jgi:hypothetical protein
MISIKKAIKTVDKISNVLEDGKYKDNLNSILESYVYLLERHEHNIKKKAEARERQRSDDEARIDNNLYHNLYYHNVVAPKKRAEREAKKKADSENII